MTPSNVSHRHRILRVKLLAEIAYFLLVLCAQRAQATCFGFVAVIAGDFGRSRRLCCLQEVSKARYLHSLRQVCFLQYSYSVLEDGLSPRQLAMLTGLSDFLSFTLHIVHFASILQFVQCVHDLRHQQLILRGVYLVSLLICQHVLGQFDHASHSVLHCLQRRHKFLLEEVAQFSEFVVRSAASALHVWVHLQVVVDARSKCAMLVVARNEQRVGLLSFHTQYCHNSGAAPHLCECLVLSADN